MVHINQTNINSEIFIPSVREVCFAQTFKVLDVSDWTEDRETWRHLHEAWKWSFSVPPVQIKCAGEKPYIFGVFFSHPFHPLSNLVLFLDVGAYDLEKSVDKTTPNESTSIFRVAPIQHVAKVPAGKVYEDWVELVDSAASLACGFFENLTA